MRWCKSCVGLGAFPGLLSVLAFLAAASAWGIEPPAPSPGSAKAFRHPDLSITYRYDTVSDLPAQSADRARQALSALSVGVDSARIDRRGGRFANLLLSHPLVPGRGVGNTVRWQDLTGSPPGSAASFRGTVWKAFADYLQTNQPNLSIDVDQLPSPGQVTVAEGGDLVQIYAQRRFNDIKVRDTYVNAVVRHGNLILLGTQNWGDLNISTQPKLGLDKAREAVGAHLGALQSSREWDRAELVIVPMARGRQVEQVALGQGYRYRLVWVVRPLIDGDLGRWEALVDAQTGQLLSFEDTNHYAEAKGGVYPVSNDGASPDGIEYPGWPMPFLDVKPSGGSTQTTDTGGNLSASGSLSSSLTGPYVDINDNCGAISLTQTDNLDFGTSGGTDCTTPGFGGAGNTHAARTGFYELNKVIEMARGQLPSNSWLQGNLTANMNINSTCNAYYNGTVNFYKSGGGCANTGELAGVFDHEWGHGMDDHDAIPGISSPSGEGIADVYTALRLNDSCIGRGFRTTNCGGNGDPCLDCTGVRDIDYMKHQSGEPHDYTWSNNTCGTSVHCIGHVYSEAVWSLWKRKLPALYSYDDNTAHEIVNRLTFIGAGGVGTWFSGGPPYGGCDSSSGYMNYLAADDDNGDLNDGTPHMNAIFEAFNDQEIACDVPIVKDAGCSGRPTDAPTVIATGSSNTVDLTWNAVNNADTYQIFRTEGVFACGFGKVKVGETAALSFADSGLQNGRDYSYVVVPMGSADTCMGRASPCVTESPAPDYGLEIDTASAAHTIPGGDGDEYLDNCETGETRFTVTNTGLNELTNVRIGTVTPSNTGVTIVSTSAPLASLSSEQTGELDFSYTGGGLSAGETLIFTVEVLADQTGLPTRSADLTLRATETDLGPVGTYTFESDLEGWTVVTGTFDRHSANGGANGSNWYMRSSDNLADQCDQVRSPVIKLTASSTLSMYTQFDIEPRHDTYGWFDRANVGLRSTETGNRTLVKPDGGRTYNASGANGTCGTSGQEGWADQALAWGQSTWSSSALNAGALAGQALQLDIRYGTDAFVHGYGLHFDHVTVTEAETEIADAQSDSCDVIPDCGNNTIETGEVCDGTDLGGLTCEDLGFTGGTLACDPDSDCQSFDTSSCTGGAVCDGDGICETGEDCNNCANDCPALSTVAVCGDGVCNAGDGEDCLSCPSDCNGLQTGKPSGRFCCGDSEVGCSDDRCTGGGFTCDVVPSSGTTCCGDGTCDYPEDSSNCELDCPADAECGNGVKEGAEQCDGQDLGGTTCQDLGWDEGTLACDSSCKFDTSECRDLCQRQPSGASCSIDSECCSDKCIGKGGGTCK